MKVLKYLDKELRLRELETMDRDVRPDGRDVIVEVLGQVKKKKQGVGGAVAGKAVVVLGDVVFSCSGYASEANTSYGCLYWVFVVLGKI